MTSGEVSKSSKQKRVCQILVCLSITVNLLAPFMDSVWAAFVCIFGTVVGSMAAVVLASCSRRPLLVAVILVMVVILSNGFLLTFAAFAFAGTVGRLFKH